MTLRECIESGGRGDFARELLKAYDSPTFENLRKAWGRADGETRAKLEKARPGLEALILAMYAFEDSDEDDSEDLACAFPGLLELETDFENPHAIDLRTGEVR
jgi:hypothetical protein